MQEIQDYLVFHFIMFLLYLLPETIPSENFDMSDISCVRNLGEHRLFTFHVRTMGGSFPAEKFAEILEQFSRYLPTKPMIYNIENLSRKENPGSYYIHMTI